MKAQGILERYASFLPLTAQTPKLTLGEGETPLVYAERLSEALSAHIYLKMEGLNPTGSFKDRGMVMAVAKAKEEGAKAIICASTGNTSASAAAYAAKAGLKCYVVIPHGYVAMGKLAQAVMYGAEIIPIEGNFDQALKLVRELSEEHPIQLVNSVNPYRIEGQKTGAFEIVEQLGKAPDIVALPVGNAGNITAYWKGFKEAYEENLCTTHPKMWGFEAEGAAAIVRNQVIEEPETFATAIRIGNPASWEKAVLARDESRGVIDEVTDEEIQKAYLYLAEKEGVFCEPASAASIAGLMKQFSQGQIPPQSTIVAILTGNGLKDPDQALQQIKEQPLTLSRTKDEIFQRIFTAEGI